MERTHEFWQLVADARNPDIAGYTIPGCACGWRGDCDGGPGGSTISLQYYNRLSWEEHVQQAEYWEQGEAEWKQIEAEWQREDAQTSATS